MMAKIDRFFGQFYSVPWCVPSWGWTEFTATVTSFARGEIVRGKSADQFADAVRDYLGMKYVLPVNRGRTAIELALRAMGIRSGDDVVMPSFVCRSVIEAVLSAGATPVFADIDDTLNVSSSTIEAALTPRTKCAIVPHLFGTAAPISEIEAMLTSRGIALIDDVAQALGARCDGRQLGTFGDCGIVSCGPGKPLMGAAGGLLLTNDPGIYQRASANRLEPEPERAVATRVIQFWIWRRLRRYSLPFGVLLARMRGGLPEPAHVNAALANVDGAIGLAQFEALDQHADERRANAQVLLTQFPMLAGQLVSDISPSGMAVKLVLLLPEGGPSVEDVIVQLAQHSIEAQGGYAPLHLECASHARLPNTQSLWRRVLCLPLETRPRARRAVRGQTGSTEMPLLDPARLAPE